eukprot:CAMPEP_0181289248 /NCGR_PEP_ID=MMETSP1101-20121128/781_1 /TAXON_ID=46948 /ORGANISM="Rhodomonas abbreviata, Strain Caron Lab Isolate" /LENGTH=274 /DNA_ID=CAMNT_0023393457 /DNA_START=652 /DNA_END=1473 /DNA_ORIENTATION=+
MDHRVTRASTAGREQWSCAACPFQGLSATELKAHWSTSNFTGPHSVPELAPNAIFQARALCDPRVYTGQAAEVYGVNGSARPFPGKGMPTIWNTPMATHHRRPTLQTRKIVVEYRQSHSGGAKWAKQILAKFRTSPTSTFARFHNHAFGPARPLRAITGARRREPQPDSTHHAPECSDPGYEYVGAECDEHDDTLNGTLLTAAGLIPEVVPASGWAAKLRQFTNATVQGDSGQLQEALKAMFSHDGLLHLLQHNRGPLCLKLASGAYVMQTANA